MKNVLTMTLVAVLILGAACGAHAQSEITLVTLAGIRAPLDELLHRFEKKTGQKVKTMFGPVGGTRKHVLDGEASTWRSSWILMRTARLGQHRPRQRDDAREPRGGRRRGAWCAEAGHLHARGVKRMLLAAKSISYPIHPPDLPPGPASPTR